MSNVEIIMIGFIAICFVQAMLCAFNAVITNLKLLARLKEHHYTKWSEFIGDDIQAVFKHIYQTPLSSPKSYYHFLFKSQEDYGDPKVRESKRQIKWGIYGFLISITSLVAAFIIGGVLLS